MKVFGRNTDKAYRDSDDMVSDLEDTLSWLAYEKQQYRYVASIVPQGSWAFYFGGSMSRVTDIRVDLHGKSFFIDAVEESSQAGQFALQYRDGRFEYSPYNKSLATETSSRIVDAVNAMEIDPGETSQLTFEGCNEVFAQHLSNWWRDAGVYALITNGVITPIEKLGDNYDVTCVVKPETRGSSYFGNSSSDEFVSYLSELTGNPVTPRRDVDNDLIVYGVGLRDIQGLEFQGREYELVSFGGGFFVRKLSTTQNMTVVFMLRFTGDACKKATEEDIISLVEQE